MSVNMSLVQSPAAAISPTTAASLEAIKSNFGIIQAAMESVLIPDVHFGVIPGTGVNAKPTLLKPGADVLCSLFHLAPAYDYQSADMGAGHREYMVTCTLSDATGRVLGQGVGLSTTLEPKYRYRKGGITCPRCGKPTIFKSKQDKGGGWYCWTKKQGCGAQFKSNDEEITGQQVDEKVEHQDPAEYYNTCLKMAAKRAQVSAVLTVTGASAVLTQDIAEDFQGNVIDAEFVEPEDLAPSLPSAEESLAQLAERCGLSEESDIALLNRFIDDSAAARSKPVDDLAAASLNHFDSFAKAFKPWFEKMSQAEKAETKPVEEPKPNGKKKTAEARDEAPPAEDKALDGDISPATLQAIEKELTRLGVPGQLPPDIIAEYDTGDPSELTEPQGRQALIYLKGMKV